jgi:hypothetical protein
MERASRFIWTLKCGRKEERLFLEAIATLLELFDQSEAIALFTDGERRYSKLLFGIWASVIVSATFGHLQYSSLELYTLKPCPI